MYLTDFRNHYPLGVEGIGFLSDSAGERRRKRRRDDSGAARPPPAGVTRSGAERTAREVRGRWGNPENRPRRTQEAGRDATTGRVRTQEHGHNGVPDGSERRTAPQTGSASANARQYGRDRNDGTGTPSPSHPERVRERATGTPGTGGFKRETVPPLGGVKGPGLASRTAPRRDDHPALIRTRDAPHRAAGSPKQRTTHRAAPFRRTPRIVLVTVGGDPGSGRD